MLTRKVSVRSWNLLDDLKPFLTFHRCKLVVAVIVSGLAFNVIEELAQELFDRINYSLSVNSLIVSVENAEDIFATVWTYFLAIVETLHDADAVEEVWASIQTSDFILYTLQADGANHKGNLRRNSQ